MNLLLRLRSTPGLSPAPLFLEWRREALGADALVRRKGSYYLVPVLPRSPSGPLGRRLGEPCWFDHGA